MFTILPRTYQFTVTDEPDSDYLKYLQRRLQDPLALSATQTPEPQAEARLDISLDNTDGDVIAGLAAYTTDSQLIIEMIWVHEALRHQGIGQHLIQMAEAEALARGCTSVYVHYASCADFYQRLGYTVTARLTHFPLGSTFYRLYKPLTEAAAQGTESAADAGCCPPDTCGRTACGQVAH